MNDWTRRQFGPLEAWGSAEPDLLLLHGAGGQALFFRAFLSRLSVPAAALNLPGHGPSADLAPGGAAPALAETIEQMAEVVESCLAALSRPVVLLGHSMGGAVTIEVALRDRARRSAVIGAEDPTRPGSLLRGIILYSTGARLRVHPILIDRMEHLYEIRMRDTVRTMFGPNASDELLDAYLALPDHPTNAQALNDLHACDRFDRIADIGSIDVPTLVLGGDSDVMTPPKFQAALVERIPGAERAIFAGAGHASHLECPAEMAAAVERFVNRLPR